MRLNDDTTIILGPPGTGKTSEIIRRITEAISAGTPPAYIGYISFTKAAVTEAKARIAATTRSDIGEFTGFRTLHSMVFFLLGLSKSEMVDPSTQIGDFGSERARLYSTMLSFSRVTGVSLSEAWSKLHSSYSGTEEDFLRFVKQYRDYKEAMQKMDFVDLIERFRKGVIRYPLTYLFVDEAQDFTPDQWAAVQLLASWSQHVIVAGDHNQSIFSWAGADGSIFKELEGHRIVLDQSFRVPRRVFKLASRVLGKIGEDVPYAPTPESGEVHWIRPDEVQTLPILNGESWFFLCRNRVEMQHLEKILYQKGIFYSPLCISKGHQIADKYLRRIYWYKNLLAGQELGPSKLRELYSLSPDLDACIKSRSHWSKAFAFWPIDRIEYYLSTEDQWNKSKVFVGTFHSSKGAEADNVVLWGNCTQKVYQAYLESSIEEWKVLYVALTRSKNRLFLVQPNDKRGIPWYQIMNQEFMTI